jgi:hypothetical protein
MAKATKVYASPDVTSFDWAHLQKDIPVTFNGRKIGGFSQVTYEELDRVPNPQYVSIRITGWVTHYETQRRLIRHSLANLPN